MLNWAMSDHHVLVQRVWLFKAQSCHLPKLHAGGGPHHLQVILEAESLLNDATSITLFLVFLKEVQDLQSQNNPPKVGAHEFGVIVGDIIWLSVGESACLMSDKCHNKCKLKTFCILTMP